MSDCVGHFYRQLALPSTGSCFTADSWDGSESYVSSTSV